MNAYDLIASDFHGRIELIAGAVDALAPGLQQVAEALADTALEDRRVFVAAAGADAYLAHYAAALLRSQDGGLPPLPAFATGVAGTGVAPDMLWGELRTLARDGDTLLFIDCTSGASTGREAMALAQERNLLPLLLSEAEALAAPAIAVHLLAGSDEQRRELALMAIHSVQQLLLKILLGET